LPPQRVDSIKELERSHARPIEVTENIEALSIKTCKVRYHIQVAANFQTDKYIFDTAYHIG